MRHAFRYLAGQCVVVGWVLAGDSVQSNMEMTVNSMQTAAEDKAQADLPLVRHFTVRAAPSTRPLDDCIGSWKVCSPETVGGFSAVLYPFGRSLFLARKAPVGLINSSVGGSHISAWFPPEVPQADPTIAPARSSIAALGEGVDFTTKEGYVAFRTAVLDRMGRRPGRPSSAAATNTASASKAWKARTRSTICRCRSTHCPNA